MQGNWKEGGTPICLGWIGDFI